MKEAISLANEELKRVDHLIYVSLKYTRTVDVIRSIVQRMITALEYMLDAHLAQAVNAKKIRAVPGFPVEKCRVLKELHPHDAVMQEMVDFYLYLRKLIRAEFISSQEFRRHVTMTVSMKEEVPIDINIDKINEFYDKIKQYYEHTVFIHEETKKEHH
ncbi:hypothetical protein HY639_05650 [Candidatus Woesearchaeota archaeon]|nr:hypothetical protein [Candidatus Woesearchaeota archaeon]